MRLPGKATWSSGEYIRLVGPRSYKIRVGSKIYVRNGHQLIPTGNPLVPKEVSHQNVDEGDGPMQPTEVSGPIIGTRRGQLTWCCDNTNPMSL